MLTNIFRRIKKYYRGKIQLGKMPIVSMSLVSKLCEKELLDYFVAKKFQ